MTPDTMRMLAAGIAAGLGMLGPGVGTGTDRPRGHEWHIPQPGGKRSYPGKYAPDRCLCRSPRYLLTDRGNSSSSGC